MLYMIVLSIICGSWVPFDDLDVCEPDIALIQSNNTGIELELSLHGMHITEANFASYSISIPEWGVVAPVGSPDLPSYIKLLAVPGENNVAIEATFSNPIVYNYRIANVKYEKDDVLNSLNRLFLSNSQHVEANATLDNFGFWRNLEVARLSITPFDYDPISETLTVYRDVTVRVEFLEELSPCLIFRNSSRIMYSNHILNFDYLDENVFVDGPGHDPINYFVYYPLQYPDVLTAIQPLIDYYDQHNPDWNITVRPINCNSITPEQLRSIILLDYISYYPEYVLLLGDHPSHYVPNYYHVGLPMELFDAGGGHAGWSDFRYSCLTGFEQGGGNDWYPEVSIGRIAGEPLYISQLVTKIIAYNEYFGPGNHIDREAEYNNPNQIALVCDNSETRFVECCTGIMNEEYNTDLNFIFMEDDQVTGDEVRTELSKGSGIVFYRGHGSRLEWLWVNEFDSTNDIGSISNDFPSISLNIACGNGNICYWPRSSNAIVDAWVRSWDHGASGSLGATADTDGSANNEFSLRLFDVLYAADGLAPLYRIGQAIQDAHVYAIENDVEGLSNARSYVWYGDPAMMIWTAENYYSHFCFHAELVSLDGNETNTIDLRLNTVQNGDQVSLTIEGLDNSMVNYSLYDLSGRCLEEVSTEGTANFSIRSLPNGVYALYAEFSNNALSSTFVVIK